MVWSPLSEIREVRNLFIAALNHHRSGTGTKPLLRRPARRFPDPAGWRVLRRQLCGLGSPPMLDWLHGSASTVYGRVRRALARQADFCAGGRYAG
jgi:hypothetical protein